jgi:hypothetical protein
MDIKSTNILNISEIMTEPSVETVEQEIQISLEELDSITTDEQKLTLWQQISDAITTARNS